MAGLVLILFSTNESMAQNCQAQFTYSLTNNILSVTSTSIGGNSFSWSFGDGNYSYGTTSTHTYSATGAYTICLIISDSNQACVDTYCDSIFVSSLGGSGCNAFFTSSTSGLVLTTNNQSTGFNPLYSWDMGDGTVINGNSPTHTYSQAGWYQVCVTLTDTAINCTSTYCDSIYVSLGCNAFFTSSANGLVLSINNQSTGFNPLYSWNMGDGTILSGNNPTHTYAQPGWYQVCVTLTDTVINCTSTYCDSVYVSLGCNASFTTSSNGLVLTTTNLSTGFNPVYSWNMGDGTVLSGANPVHTYAQPGWYSVCLTLTDTVINCTSTFCSQVYISSGCNASFTTSTSGLVLTTNNLSTGFNPVYSWDMGDGTVLSGTNPTHTYSQPGWYNVCLTLTDTVINCIDSFCMSVYFPPTLLCGQVYAGNSVQPDATIYLIQLDLWTGILTAVDTIIISQGDSGYYCFTPPSNGTYMVKAALNSGDPNYSTYLPTYHTSNLFWQGATNVTVGPSVWNADITMIGGTNPGGPGFIGGSIFQGANKKAGPGDPIVNAEVLLLDQSGNPVAYDISDSDGKLNFTNLAYGTYQVHAEVLGKNTTPAWVTIGPDQPSFGSVEIVVNKTEVTTAIGEPLKGIANMSNVFPNPTNDIAALNVQAVTATQINLRVINLLGQPVLTDRQAVSSGANRIELNVAGLAPGIYLLEMTSEDGTFSQTTELVKR